MSVVNYDLPTILAPDRPGAWHMCRNGHRPQRTRHYCWLWEASAGHGDSGEERVCARCGQRYKLMFEHTTATQQEASDGD